MAALKINCGEVYTITSDYESKLKTTLRVEDTGKYEWMLDLNTCYIAGQGADRIRACIEQLEALLDLIVTSGLDDPKPKPNPTNDEDIPYKPTPIEKLTPPRKEIYP